MGHWRNYRREHLRQTQWTIAFVYPKRCVILVFFSAIVTDPNVEGYPTPLGPSTGLLWGGGGGQGEMGERPRVTSAGISVAALDKSFNSQFCNLRADDCNVKYINDWRGYSSNLKPIYNMY